MCERSQGGGDFFFPAKILALCNKFFGEGGGNGGEGIEMTEHKWAPMPKGVFTATEGVGMIYL